MIFTRSLSVKFGFRIYLQNHTAHTCIMTHTSNLHTNMKWDNELKSSCCKLEFIQNIEFKKLCIIFGHAHILQMVNLSLIEICLNKTFAFIYTRYVPQ